MPLKVPAGPNAATTLADFTSPALILPGLRSNDSAGVIAELARALGQEGCVPDPAVFTATVLKREALCSTVMESGMAFPHARLESVPRLAFALGRRAEPLAWGPAGAPPVSLVFLLAVPASEAAGYLALISGLARFSRQPGLIPGLLAAAGSAGMLALLQQVPVKKGG
jgi:mannitol/fructose-specific phosphotransferase system IIA component (Ntr-type)